MNRNPSPRHLTFASQAAIAAVFLIGAGCALSYSCKTKTVPGNGTVISVDVVDLNPTASPGTNAMLVLGGTEIPVAVQHKVESGAETIRLLTMGEEIDVERYKLAGQKFYLVQAASERFEEPLPLLEFPVTDGQRLEWKGKLSMGDINKDASSVTIVTKDKLNEKGFSGEAVRASVELSFDGGGPKPTIRKLSFWFVPDKGILKRDFDKGSTRIPAHDVTETKTSRPPHGAD